MKLTIYTAADCVDVRTAMIPSNGIRGIVYGQPLFEMTESRAVTILKAYIQPRLRGFNPTYFHYDVRALVIDTGRAVVSPNTPKPKRGAWSHHNPESGIEPYLTLLTDAWMKQVRDGVRSIGEILPPPSKSRA